MSEMALYLGVSFTALFLMMSGVWLIQFFHGNAGIVDIFWGLSFPVSVLLYLFLCGKVSLLDYAIVIMVVLWGFRLAIYLFGRNWGKAEDARYTNLRKEWGTSAQVKMFLFFQFQALLSSLLSLPFLLVFLDESTELFWSHYAGISLWTIGLIGETVADHQLRRFKRIESNRGKVCSLGLWNYSRHPNYFFEWLIWVGYFLFALSSPYGIWAVISPVLMLHFLLNVTGIKYSEEHMLQTKGAAYEYYKATTSAFIPLPKRTNRK